MPPVRSAAGGNTTRPLAVLGLQLFELVDDRCYLSRAEFQNLDVTVEAADGREALRRGERLMYGTVGRVKVNPDNREKLLHTLQSQGNVNIPGFNRAYVMFPENRDGEAVMVVFFDGKDSYWKIVE